MQPTLFIDATEIIVYSSNLLVGDEIATHLNFSNGLDPLTSQKRPIDFIGAYSGPPSPAPSASGGTTTHRIYTRLVSSASSRGPLYEAIFQDEVIIARSPQPFLDGCRVLSERGYRGAVELWDYERPYPRMRGLIEAAAQLAVDETGTPRFRNHRQHWRTEVRKAAADEAATSLPAAKEDEI